MKIDIVENTLTGGGPRYIGTTYVGTSTVPGMQFRISTGPVDAHYTEHELRTLHKLIGEVLDSQCKDQHTKFFNQFTKKETE